MCVGASHNKSVGFWRGMRSCSLPIMEQIEGREGKGVVREIEGRSWRGYQENESSRIFVTWKGPK